MRRFFSLIIAFYAATASASAVDDAFKLCQAFESSGATSCEVSGLRSTIDVTLNMTARDANTTCQATVKAMAQKSTAFGGRWKLRIFSPYGPRPIAACTL